MVGLGAHRSVGCHDRSLCPTTAAAAAAVAFAVGDARIQRQAMKMMWTTTTMMMMITTVTPYSVPLCLCLFIRLFVCVPVCLVSFPVFLRRTFSLRFSILRSSSFPSFLNMLVRLSLCVSVPVRLSLCPDVPRKPFSITKDSPFPSPPSAPLAHDLSLSGRGRSLSP